MKPASFEYHAPESLADALAMLASLGEETRPLAGGQSLVPMMNLRIARPEHVVDLNGIAGLGDIGEGADRVEIGALVRHAAVERSALLARACPILPAVAATIGHYAIRQRGTVGGSLALADPAAQWPLLAILLDGEIAVAGSDAARRVRAQEFFRGIFTTALGPAELVTGMTVPKLAHDEGWGHRAFCRRHGDFAIVAAAATVALGPAGTVARLRLALGGVGDTPVALGDLAAGQVGSTPDAEWADAVARLAAAAIQPQDDHQASAEFRRELARAMVERALGDALARVRM